MASLTDSVYESTDYGTDIQCKDLRYVGENGEYYTKNNLVSTSVMPATPPPTLSRKAILCGFCWLIILVLVIMGLSVGTIIWVIKSQEGNGSSNSTSSSDKLAGPAGPAGPPGPPGPPGPGVVGPIGSPGQVAKNNSGSGSSYIRWGKKTCRGTAELVYSGLAAGTHWSHAGGGSNFLCLPETPEYREYYEGAQPLRAYLDGVEYHIRNFPWMEVLDNQDAPCAVCSVASRSIMIMIPAKKTCPSGWTREYQGYLVSSRDTHKRTEFICLDHSAEALEGTSANEDGSLWYLVEVRCVRPDPNVYTGGLSCDKYPTGYELACVVCTK